MSYDPKVGRFQSRDPVEFRGGDGNLYRYVGDDPTNHTDPTGLLGEPSGPGSTGIHTNVPRGGLGSYVGGALSSYAPPKDQILDGVPILRGTPTANLTGGPVGSGTYWIGRPPEGGLMGVGGAATCTGVILVPIRPGPTSSSVIFHIGGMDNARGTLSQLDLSNYRAYLSGAGQTFRRGNEAMDSDARYALQAVIAELRRQHVLIAGYAETGELAVDSQGNVFNTTPSTRPASDSDQFIVPSPPRPRGPIGGFILLGPFVYTYPNEA